MRIAIGSDPNAESAKIELIKHIEKGGYGEMCIRDRCYTLFQQRCLEDF